MEYARGDLRCDRLHLPAAAKGPLQNGDCSILLDSSDKEVCVCLAQNFQLVFCGHPPVGRAREKPHWLAATRELPKLLGELIDAQIELLASFVLDIGSGTENLSDSRSQSSTRKRTMVPTMLSSSAARPSMYSVICEYCAKARSSAMPSLTISWSKGSADRYGGKTGRELKDASCHDGVLPWRLSPSFYWSEHEAVWGRECKERGAAHMKSPFPFGNGPKSV